MLLWILGVLVLLGASALLARFVAVEMVPAVVDAFAQGEAVSVLLLSLVTMAMALIVVTALVAAPLTHSAELRQRVLGTEPPNEALRRQLRRNATASPRPVRGVKLANVHWHAPEQEPEFSGASGGSPYQREDIACCGHRPVDALCVDQDTHRCGFYALPTGNALLAELTGLSEAEAVDAYDWRDVLEPFGETAHLLTVALHGEVITYDTAARGQCQTVTAVDLPAACSRAHCDEPVDAVAAVGWPLGLCALHASSPEVADHTLALTEFARRFDIALRPTTPIGQPTSLREGHRLHAPASPALAEQPAADTPVEHRQERVEGWLAGSFDVDRGQLVTDSHRLDAHTRAAEPVTAARDGLSPPSGLALARVRLGGEVVVRRRSVSSRDVQLWDLYLPEHCQLANCQDAAELVDRDGSLAIARCRTHASESARPASHYGADHGVEIKLGA